MTPSRINRPGLKTALRFAGTSTFARVLGFCAVRAGDDLVEELMHYVLHQNLCGSSSPGDAMDEFLLRGCRHHGPQSAADENQRVCELSASVHDDSALDTLFGANGPCTWTNVTVIGFQRRPSSQGREEGLIALDGVARRDANGNRNPESGGAEEPGTGF